MPPAQIAGFLDGDGSVGIYAADLDAQHVRVTLRVVTRDDDPTPLLMAASASAALKRRIGHVAWRAPRQHGWLVTSADELADLLWWLSDTPSLAPRAWRRMKAVREAALLMADAPRHGRHFRPLSPGTRARLRELNEMLVGERWRLREEPEMLRLVGYGRVNFNSGRSSDFGGSWFGDL